MEQTCRIKQSCLRRASNIKGNFRNDFRLTELPFAMMTPAMAAANGCISLFVACQWLLTVTLVTFRWWSTENGSSDTSLCLGNVWQEISPALLSAKDAWKRLGAQQRPLFISLTPTWRFKKVSVCREQNFWLLTFSRNIVTSGVVKPRRYYLSGFCSLKNPADAETLMLELVPGSLCWECLTLSVLFPTNANAEYQPNYLLLDNM